MRGKDYVALRRLSDRANKTLAAVGETCDNVPEASLDGLILRGIIVARDLYLREPARPAPQPEPVGEPVTDYEADLQSPSEPEED